MTTDEFKRDCKRVIDFCIVLRNLLHRAYPNMTEGNWTQLEAIILKNIRKDNHIDWPSVWEEWERG